MEAKVAAAWQEVLGVEAVGVHDNFFELGGDSIQSIQIVNRLRAQGLSIRPSLLFLHQTVAALAAALEETDPALSAEREEPPRRDFSIEGLGEGELATLAGLLRDADTDDGLSAGDEAEEVASS
jgi:aryl carrier-like protein